MSCDELIDEFMQPFLKEKEEMVKIFEEHYNWIQNNGATAINTQLNRTNDNNTEMYNIRNFNSEEFYRNSYSNDTNFDDKTNDESD